MALRRTTAFEHRSRWSPVSRILIPTEQLSGDTPPGTQDEMFSIRTTERRKRRRFGGKGCGADALTGRPLERADPSHSGRVRRTRPVGPKTAGHHGEDATGSPTPPATVPRCVRSFRVPRVYCLACVCLSVPASRASHPLTQPLHGGWRRSASTFVHLTLAVDAAFIQITLNK